MEEYLDVKHYTKPTFGKAVNYRLRHNIATAEDIRFLHSIESAINKFILKKSCLIFRGFPIDRDEFNNKYLKAFKNQTTIIGSKICSTSRGIVRAIEGAYTEDPNKVGLVFRCGLISGDHALPIESISTNDYEKEILLASPHYYIQNIEKTDFCGRDLMIIDIILVR